jgi:hypothetical protein
MRRPTHYCLWLLLVALLLAPAAGLAATISSVTIVKNAGNSADFFDDVGDVASAVQSTAVVSSSSASAFATRYAAVVSADRGGNPGPAGTTVQNFTGNFTITFNVTETAGVNWGVTLAVLRVGAQTIISDGTGNAAVALSALTGGETGAGSITSGSLGLGVVTTLNNAATVGTPSVDTPFSQTTNAILSGIGTGFAQAVILNFTFTASATTVDPAGGTLQGDEAALRMGLNSALSSFTADDYPGVGARLIAGDGIFINAGLVAAPEPGTATLLGLGLGVLAYLRRRS